MKNVTIYTTPTCHFCHAAKDFFKEHNVMYTEKDVAGDAVARKEMVEKSGQMGVPVIFVDSDMIVGFDESRLKQVLAIA
jgi:glutaredoxin-like YruB-family protein